MEEAMVAGDLVAAADLAVVHLVPASVPEEDHRSAMALRMALQPSAALTMTTLTQSDSSPLVALAVEAPMAVVAHMEPLHPPTDSAKIVSIVTHKAFAFGNVKIKIRLDQTD